MSMQTRLMSALRQAGPGGASIAQLRRETDLPRATLFRALRDATDANLVGTLGRGLYRSSEFSDLPPAGLATVSGEVLWRAVSRLATPAYVSGLDVLAGLAQQQQLRFPHLLVTAASPIEVALEIEKHGFIAVDGELLAGDVDKTVLLRRRSDWLGTMAVVAGVATPARAWLDLYREVRAGTMHMSGRELGAILARLLEIPEEHDRLRTLAARAGPETSDLVRRQQARTDLGSAVLAGAAA